MSYRNKTFTAPAAKHARSFDAHGLSLERLSKNEFETTRQSKQCLNTLFVQHCSPRKAESTFSEQKLSFLTLSVPLLGLLVRVPIPFSSLMPSTIFLYSIMIFNTESFTRKISSATRHKCDDSHHVCVVCVFGANNFTQACRTDRLCHTKHHSCKTRIKRTDAFGVLFVRVAGEAKQLGTLFLQVLVQLLKILG